MLTFVRRLAFLLLATTLAGCGFRGPTGTLIPQNAAVGIDGKKGGYKLLYLFKGGTDGANPYDGLTPLRGSLYGVTYGDKLSGPGSMGTVFAVSTFGKERAIYRFKGFPNDGALPVGNLVVVNGLLYGTTFDGGKFNLGCVFEVSPSGNERVVYSFKSGTDAQGPGAGLLSYKGKLYGTTVDGGSDGDGTVFDVTTSGDEHVLHSFKGFPTDGESPRAPLIVAKGELYGTAYEGGTDRYGTVFKITTAGKEKTLYNFMGPPDAALPLGGLTRVGSQLYGTSSGGTGAIFKVSLSGHEKVLYPFKGSPDGEDPAGALVFLHGKFYGTTQEGGQNAFGTIFDVTKSGSEQVLYSFKGSPKDGATPFGTLLALGNVLYGTTQDGGHPDGGTLHADAGSIFKFTP